VLRNKHKQEKAASLLTRRVLRTTGTDASAPVCLRGEDPLLRAFEVGNYN